jgi:hypothetical protein
MRGLLLVAFVFVPTLAMAQATYLDRATMGRDPEFIARVGVAVQGQAILAEGESPDLCCQTTTQIEMVGLKGGIMSLCDIKRPPGSPTAPDASKLLSRDRHAARQRFNRQIMANAVDWANRMAPIVASDTCVPLTVTDAQLQTYVLRLWDVMALPPELANEPFVPATPTATAPPPMPAVAAPPRKPPGDR